MSRHRSKIAAPACIVAVLTFGCGAPTRSIEPPGEAAVRVFRLAEGLERDHKTKQAFAAYRQVQEQFPGTPESRKAAERIRQAQRGAQKRSAYSHKNRAHKQG